MSSPGHLSAKNQLFHDQVEQLYALAHVGIIASLINGPILVFVLWGQFRHPWLLSWLGGVLLVNASLGFLVFRYRRHSPEADHSSQWCAWFVTGHIALGLVWGAAGSLLYPTNSLTHEIVLTLVIAGMVAGSTAVHSALQRAFLAYSLPAASPLILRIFQQGDALHIAIGMMSVLFMVLMVLTSRRNYFMIMKSMTLRHENDQLLDQISMAKNRLEFMVETRTEELKASESRYRLLAENIRDVIWIMALDGSHFSYISLSITPFCGYTPKQAMAHSLEETLTASSARTVRDVLEYEFVIEKPDPADRLRSQILELEYRCRDGSTVWAEVRISLLYGESDHAIGVMGVTRDVTERKQMDEEKQRLESQLLHSQKIEAVGTLAGGIAHDFNNYLTSVLGNISLAKHKNVPSQAENEFLHKAEQATLRAKELTQQLLTFAKGGEPVKQLISLDAVIKESSSFTLSGSAVACEYVFPTDLWPTDVDPGQISQVVHNIVINAVHAMANGGTLSIQGENLLLDARSQDKNYSLPPGPYLKISFRDQGGGISEEHLSRIFDPYFTTKTEGHGLGLASVYSIMKKHGGMITVESKLGIGTEFALLFPASPDAQVSSAPDLLQLKRGSGIILIMDDDEFIRDMVGEMLIACGYSCQFAKDGHEAITRYKEAMKCGQRFSAVILDLTIAGSMGGIETVRRLQSIDPGVKAIVSSGYSNAPVMANHQVHGFHGVVRKPYSIEEMSRVVHQVVMESSPP